MNSNYDGFNGTYGAAQYTVLAELGHLWNQSAKARHTHDNSQIEAQIWLWEHKALFFLLGALLVAGLLVAGGQGV